MKARELVEILMPVIKSSLFRWLILQPFIYIVYLPLWGLGIINYYMMLNQSIQWLLLAKLNYIIAIYILYSFRTIYYQEDKMNSLLTRSVIFVAIGMIFWILLSFQAAY